MDANCPEFSSDVVIVGGGPVGLGLAIDLALRGTTSHVIERTKMVHRIPKGQNLTQRTGEHFRAWGISQRIRAASPIPRDFGNAGLIAYGSLMSEYRYDWFVRGAVNQFYLAQNERLPQYELERVLRERAGELEEIIIHYGWKPEIAEPSTPNSPRGVTAPGHLSGKRPGSSRMSIPMTAR